MPLVRVRQPAPRCAAPACLVVRQQSPGLIRNHALRERVENGERHQVVRIRVTDPPMIGDIIEFERLELRPRQLRLPRLQCARGIARIDPGQDGRPDRGPVPRIQRVGRWGPQQLLDRGDDRGGARRNAIIGRGDLRVRIVQYETAGIQVGHADHACVRAAERTAAQHFSIQMPFGEVHWAIKVAVLAEQAPILRAERGGIEDERAWIVGWLREEDFPRLDHEQAADIEAARAALRGRHDLALLGQLPHVFLARRGLDFIPAQPGRIGDDAVDLAAGDRPRHQLVADVPRPDAVAVLFDDLDERLVGIAYPSRVVFVHPQRDRGGQRRFVAGCLDEVVEAGDEVRQVGEAVRDVEAVAAVRRGELALVRIEQVARQARRCRVRHQQRVALVDAGLRGRGQGAAQGRPRHLHRHRVDVDPVYQVARDPRPGRGVRAGQASRNRGQDPPRRVEQERARTAGRVQHPHARRRRVRLMRGPDRLVEPIVVQGLFDDQVRQPVRRVVLAVELAIRLGHDLHVDVAQHVRLAGSPVVALHDGEQLTAPLHAARRIGQPSDEAVRRRLVRGTVQRPRDVPRQRDQQAMVEEQRIPPLIRHLDPAAAHQVAPEPHLGLRRLAVAESPNAVQPIAQRAEEIGRVRRHPGLARGALGQCAAGGGERVRRALEVLLVQRGVRNAVHSITCGRPLPRPPADSVRERPDPRRIRCGGRDRRAAPLAFAQREHVAPNLPVLRLPRLAAGQIRLRRAALLDFDHHPSRRQEQIAGAVARLVLKQHFAAHRQHLVQRVLHLRLRSRP